jgi:hypothetical protein
MLKLKLLAILSKVDQLKLSSAVGWNGRWHRTTLEKPGVVAHAVIPALGGGGRGSWVWGQPGLHSKF